MAKEAAYRFAIKKSELRSMPLPELRFLLVSSHCVNEVCALQKLLAIQALSLDRSEPEKGLQAQQALLILRLLAAKLFEAWNTCSHHFGRILKTYEPQLEPEARASLRKLQTCFKSESTLKIVRDKFAFHYSADRLEAEFLATSDDHVFHAVAGTASGNTFLGFADEVAGLALLKVFGKESLQDALNVWFDEVSNIGNDFVCFATNAIMLIIEAQAPDTFNMEQAEEIDLSRQPRLDQIRLPFLFRRPA